MSITFNGWIEFRDIELERWSSITTWYALVDASLLADAGHNGAGMLFGVGNIEFPPLAEGRGLPGDVSDGVKRDIAQFPPRLDDWVSYVTWAEIQAADNNLEWVYLQVHKYEPQAFGEPKWLGSSRADPAEHRAAGDTWEEGGYVFTCELVNWREYITEPSGFALIFEIMASVAKRYGDDQVRLVAWFE